MTRKHSHLLIAMLLLFTVSNAYFDEYKQFSYAQMRNEIKKLNTKYPDIVHIDTASTKYGIDY